MDVPGRLVATIAVVIHLPTEVEEPAGEGAVAAYTAMLLGNAPHARTGSVGEAARIGAAITTGCDHRGPKVIADCPVTEVPRLLDALAAMLMRFEPTRASFEECRGRLAAEREMEPHHPAALANKLFSESVLDPTNRYARPVGGTARSWQTLTRETIVSLHRRHVGPQRMTMIIVGDLASSDVEASVRESFAHFPRGECAEVVDRPPAPGGGPKLSWRAGQGGEQTRLMLGCFAIDRLDPRWPSARVAAELFGGGPDALVNAELRGRLGISYGIDVRFVPYFRGGLFVIAGSVTAGHTAQALAAIRGVLTRTLEEGVDPVRFARVRERMVEAAAETYETTLALAQQHAELTSCGIEPSFIDGHLEAIRTLEPARLDEDLRTLVDPRRLHVAVVGQFDPDASEVADLERA
ncbi:insulinase family protein [Embleya sp. NBC_00888]|uniref:M16 family metallopeptidase n=1 Tax=Embleya sp. NBC_00888 TaxID=2975960 RepID=UPI003865C479|nr:insulinase family protein [Embleya sp. NBC_00888]